MIISIFTGVICLIVQIVLASHIENPDWRAIIITLSGLGYVISFIIASDKYDKLKSRIKALEDKTENNAEHIHKLAKKQSNKTIEYYTDEM